MNSSILCSVVIPTFNRGAGLKDCLNSVAAQNTTDFEVIVVDDCSESETEAQEIVAAIAKERPHISFRCIRQKENGGHGKARNAGVKVACGKIILFTDDDCTVPSDWVLTHIDAHERYPTAAGVGGWYWPPPKTSRNVYDRFYELQYEYSYPKSRDCARTYW